MSEESRDQEDEPRRNQENRPAFPAADLVSLESVVNIMIRKGICTPEELFEEEQNRRRQLEASEATPTVQITNIKHLQNNGNGGKSRPGWLKRKMSKYRWSRRLGTTLFGWKWKKVKINKEVVKIENKFE